ncbi:MAG: IS30 family transposase [Gammaproteobacteria bacterium]
MYERGDSKGLIAKRLGVHRSTIYREIRRNSWTHWLTKKRYYCSMMAQRYALKRCQRFSKLLRDQGLRNYVHQRLRMGWSPWQIEGRLKREHEGHCQISHESIYRYIYSEAALRHRFYKRLRRRHVHRVRRNTRKRRFPKELLIDQRSECINRRETFGHWECDLMLFKRGIKSNLITLRERKTRYFIAIKNTSKQAKSTALALIHTMKLLKSHIHSITFDQGSEFQRYSWIRECLETSIYFCQPGSPYQKGSVENGNGVLRVELPRSTNVTLLRQQEIDRLVNEVNHRPLKCLNYQTPAELFSRYTKGKINESIHYQERI